MGKHAYLILCHNQWELLQILLQLLDDERNDIFIHVDAKSKFNPKIVDVCKRSKVILTERIRVQWGGYSVVKATMILLKVATENDKYDYYHLLSGCDLPLKNQDEIHEFFEKNKGKEYISLKSCDHMERVKYYYPTQDLFSKKNLLGKVSRKILRNGSLIIQKALGTDRTKKSLYTNWGYGSQFFDISDSFARYLCENADKIYRTFHWGFIIDELFVQTIWLNSPYNIDGARYINTEGRRQKYIENIYMDINRAIDWKRGSPYIYQQNDYRLLVESNCLFARKFDLNVDRKIVGMIENSIKSR